jgi:ATP/maltotriose-dependent transcriptional regulator MalT
MRIFISYGRNDTLDFAKRLAAWLREQGHDPWLDIENGIPPGAPFDIKIEVGIRECELVLSLLSPWSVRPEGFCRNELLYAQAHNINILPVRIADVVPPIQIISLNFLDASRDPEIIFSLLPETLGQIAKKTYPWKSIIGAGKWYEKIRVLSFQEELRRFGGEFTGREWLFEKLKTWATEKDSRLLLLTGDAGIGKSALSARLTACMDVKGIHFCSRSNPDSCRPESLIAALIYQFAQQFPPYREILDQLPQPEANMPPEALFRTLVTDPLEACENRLGIESTWIVVVDGLDEAVAGAGNAMVDFLVESVERFPSGLRVIATSRPDRELVARLRGEGIRQEEIKAASADNRSDVGEYIRARVLSEGLSEIPGVTQKIDDLAAGNFLYAKMVLDALTDTEHQYRLTPDDLGSLPPALGGLYDRIFRKRFMDTRTYENEIAPLISCLAVTRMPIPETMLIAASGLDKRTVIRGLRALSQFLSRDGDGLRLFHQSLIQWLTADPVENPFAVLPEEGYRRLADEGMREVLKGENEVPDYVLLTLPYYLVAAKRIDELAELIKNPEYIHGICGKNTEWLLEIWSSLESSTDLRIETAYNSLIEDSSYLDCTVLNDIALLLENTGHLDRAMTVFKKQERICRELRNMDGIQISLGHQGEILITRGDLNGGMALFKEQERICRELGNMDGLSESLGNQGVILFWRDDLDEAMIRFKEGQQIIRELPENKGKLAILYINQAMTLYKRGDLNGAMVLLKEQERICRELGIKMGLSFSLSSQAAILMDRGDIDGAIVLLKEQERICRELGNMDGLSESLGNQGVMLSRRGDLDGGMALFKEQERICRELGNKYCLEISLGNQTIILKRKGDHKGANNLVKEVKRIKKEIAVGKKP